MLKDAPLSSIGDARALICELGRRFYALGWVSGTGGGISVKHDGRILMAPSGVQKELISPDDIFVLDNDGNVISGPAPERGLRVSECRPLFLHAFQKRDAGAVIHTHSRLAVIASLLVDDAIEFTGLEMMKGLRGVGAFDRHSVPVIENTARECDLADTLGAAIDDNEGAHAVVVRRHGIYVWGNDWREAKRHAECYDALFDTVIEMHRLGISPTDAP